MNQPTPQPTPAITAPAAMDSEAIRSSTIAMLQSQAQALNGVFNRLIKEMEARPTVEEVTAPLRLVLKIQSQCRATCQMLLKLLDPDFAKKSGAKKESAADRIAQQAAKTTAAIATSGAANASLPRSQPRP